MLHFSFSIFFPLHSSQVTVISGLGMAQASADSAQQESGKTPTHESRDSNFTVLTEFHFAGLIDSQASISYLKKCQATTVNRRISNQNSTKVPPSYMDLISLNISSPVFDLFSTLHLLTVT